MAVNLNMNFEWRRHKIKENGNISIVGPFQLIVIVWKCYARRF